MAVVFEAQETTTMLFVAFVLLLATSAAALSDCSQLTGKSLEHCRTCVANLVDPISCLDSSHCSWANYQCSYGISAASKPISTHKPTKRTKKPTAYPTRRPHTTYPSRKPTPEPTRKLNAVITTMPTATIPEPVPPQSGEDELPLPKKRQNILLIIGDDLRQTPIAPEGSTPNLDKLRKQSLDFDTAYCNVPLCGPSRASFLNGREPLETGVYGNKMVLNSLGPATKSMPQFFKDHGYETKSFGKVFHHPALNDFSAFSSDSWTGMPVPRLARQDSGYLMNNCLPSDINKSTQDKKSWQKFAYGEQQSASTVARPYQCNMGTSLDDFDDMYIAGNAVDSLLQAKQPFFYVVGFYRPHLPHTVHTSIWDQFEVDLAKNASKKFTVTAPKHRNWPEPQQSMPERFAIVPDERDGSGQGQVIPSVYQAKPVLTPHFIQAMRAGYSAAMAQMDLALGKLLNGLQESGFEDNTLVVLVGDNGFNLGESSLWYKQLLTDHSARVPFIVRMPSQQKQIGGVKNDVFVELLDLYRTFADFGGLLDKVEPGIGGRSLLPVFVNPTKPQEKEFGAAVSIIHRCEDRQCADWDFKQVGFSVRTTKWRYNVWLVAQGIEPSPLQWTRENIAGEELYNHETEGDEDHFNLASQEEYADVKQELFAILKQRYSKFSPTVGPTSTPTVSPSTLEPTTMQPTYTRYPTVA